MQKIGFYAMYELPVVKWCLKGYIDIYLRLKSASLESDYDQAPTCCESTGFPSSIDYFIVPWRSDDIRLHDLSPCSVLGPCWFLCVSGISFTTRWVRGRGRKEISALTASPGLSTSSRWRFPGIKKNALFRR